MKDMKKKKYLNSLEYNKKKEKNDRIVDRYISTNGEKKCVKQRFFPMALEKPIEKGCSAAW